MSLRVAGKATRRVVLNDEKERRMPTKAASSYGKAVTQWLLRGLFGSGPHVCEI
jgi:hypothetical protein